MGRYARGKHARAMCPVEGHEVRYKDLKLRWDGLWVSKEAWDKKHEQIDPIRNVHDPQALEHPQPDSDNDDPNGNLSTLLTDEIPATFGSG